MSLVAKLTKIAGGGLIRTISDAADRFIQTDDEKSKFKVELEKVIQRRESEIEQTIRSELTAKERIIVAEMTQGDNYTKRARPTVIYMGLAIITFNYCLIPLIQMIKEITISPFALPTEFWLAWGGCVSVYNVGRSLEKRGIRNKFTQFAVGSDKISIFD